MPDGLGLRLVGNSHFDEVVIKGGAAAEIGEFFGSRAVCVTSAGNELAPPDRRGRNHTRTRPVGYNGFRQEVAPAVENLDWSSCFNAAISRIIRVNLQCRSHFLMLKQIHEG